MNPAQAEAGNTGFVTLKSPVFAFDQRDFQLFGIRHDPVSDISC